MKEIIYFVQLLVVLSKSRKETRSQIITVNPQEASTMSTETLVKNDMTRLRTEDLNNYNSLYPKRIYPNDTTARST